MLEMFEYIIPTFWSLYFEIRILLRKYRNNMRIGIIPYKREVPLTIYYKNEPLNKFYIPDFICFDKIIVELKALSAITNE